VPLSWANGGHQVFARPSAGTLDNHSSPGDFQYNVVGGRTVRGHALSSRWADDRPHMTIP
jgi:hypothetical protein